MSISPCPPDPKHAESRGLLISFPTRTPQLFLLVGLTVLYVSIYTVITTISVLRRAD